MTTVAVSPGSPVTVPFADFTEGPCAAGAAETAGATVTVDDPGAASAAIVTGQGVMITAGTVAPHLKISQQTPPLPTSDAYGTVVRYIDPTTTELGQVNVRVTEP